MEEEEKPGIRNGEETAGARKMQESCFFNPRGKITFVDMW